MPKSRFLRCHDRRYISAAAVSGALLLAPAAQAEFSPPPESSYRLEDQHRVEPPLEDGRREAIEPWEPPAHASTFRFHVGPAALLQPTSSGLFTALDIGRRAVGARVSASWLRAESDQGLSAYTAELWIDFRNREELHPVVGAGASLLRGRALGEHQSVGAGVLRGALEYELPIADADARLSLNLLALVPAIATERTRPWAIATLMVGAGF